MQNSENDDCKLIKKLSIPAVAIHTEQYINSVLNIEKQEINNPNNLQIKIKERICDKY